MALTFANQRFVCSLNACQNFRACTSKFTVVESGMRFDSQSKVYLAVFLTTVISVVMSILITGILQGGFDDPEAMAPAIIVPLLVAPLVSFWGFSQSRKIEQLNAELSNLLSHDPLTNVRSRSYFFDAASKGSADEAAVVLMVDADHFKNINDTFGHHVGDKALQHFSELISNQCRKSDIVARLGGEEFGIYMPKTEVSTARAVAERIRAEIYANPLQLDGSEISLSTSIGVAVRQPGEQIESALKRADFALYHAKESGRNRVTVETPVELGSKQVH